MRKTVTIAATLIVALSAMAGAIPYGAKIFTEVGKVTAVDDTAKTFTCREKTGDTTYEIREAVDDITALGIRNETIFWLGEQKVSRADLKVGTWVKVTSHDESGDRVAEKVEILVPKAARPRAGRTRFSLDRSECSPCSRCC